MVPKRSILVTLLLVVSLTAVPPPASSQTADPTDNGAGLVHQLSAPNETISGPAWQVGLNGSDPIRSNTARIGLDVGAAMALQHGRVESRLMESSLRERYAAADSDDGRFAVLTDASDHISDNLDTLNAAEEQATGAYATDSISTSTYLDRLTRVQHQAHSLQSTIDWIESSGSAIDSAEIVRRSGALRARAATLTWPIRDRIAATQAGTEPRLALHVTSSSQGFVVSTIIDEEFVREARRYDRRSTDGPTSDLRVSLDEIYATYPTAVSNVNAISVGGERSSGVFYATIETSTGLTITSYIDNRNLLIFEEVYRQPLATLPTLGGVQTTGNGLTLLVSRTLEGGPMSVTVLDAETGDPVDAQVAVDGRIEGRTGADGRLWLLDDGGPAAVRVSGPSGAQVSYTVEGPVSNEST